jgi:hypothetical protein
LDGVRGLGGAEAPLDASNHQVADHLTGDASRGGRPSHDLAIAGVDSEQHAYDILVAAG